MVRQSGQLGAWAWVTSALNKDEVENAIVLAGSLKGVHTSGKLVVIASPNLPESIREKLYNKFDLVSLLDETCPKDEDYVKVFAFTLTLFQGCVYLPPNSLVLKKCDDIFDYCSSPKFFVGLPSLKNSFAFLFKPSVIHFQCLKGAFKATRETSNFMQYLQGYAKNNKLKVAELGSQLFHEMKLVKGQLFDGFSKVAVTNFGKCDPKKINLTPNRLGLLEKFAIDCWWKLYHKELGEKASIMFGPQFDSQKYANEQIAIVGMSCRFPGANSLDEFWQLLAEGREGIQKLPSHRWLRGDTLAKANAKCRNVHGGFLNIPIDEFDYKFFGISPKEVEYLDPQLRLLHELTYEAIEDANIDVSSLRGSHTGVWVGSWLSDYKDLAVKSIDRDFVRIYMGNSLSASAARLSHFYEFTGPSVGTESACSSSIVSVDMACKSLRSGETNLALAAGVTLFVHPFDNKSIQHVLAPNGRCKTFDANADGFGRAESVAVLILKRMSDAIADGDKIWALIRGSALSQEGVSKSMGTPTVQCESLAMELALKDANVDPQQVSYIEAHGTGTSVGDPMEVAAINKVYGNTNRPQPLWIGSVKTNVGHTEATSGITGIIKVVLSMKNEIIPKHLNFKTLNPEINLDAIPARIPLESVEWKRDPNIPRIAGVSSFGISGTDGHAIIQEPPITDNKGNPQLELEMDRPLHFMKISAKTTESLDALLGKYEALLSNDCQSRFEDIAHSANVGRATYNNRAVIIAKDNVEALKMIKGGNFKRKEVHGGMEAKVCFLFTGQGSQYHGMANELYKTNGVFRMAFDKCDNYLKSLYKIDIGKIMWEENSTEKGLLNRTIYSQIAIFVVEYCLMQLWNSWGITADFVLGHSLGEFCAAICAGILDLPSALKMVVQRSLLIDALPQGKMLVIKANQNKVEELIASFKKEHDNGHRHEIDLAAVNSPDQTVLAADSEIISKFAEFCSKKQVKSVVLAATHAFHSKHMDPILSEYEDVVKNILDEESNSTDTSLGSCQYISGMEGRLVTELGDIKSSSYWVRHTREKVSFVEASKAALESGCNIFLEIGPSPVLSTFIMMNGGSAPGYEFSCLPSLRKNQNDWTTLLESLSKLFLLDYSNLNFDWNGFDQYYKRNKVDLPFYQFQRKKIGIEFRSVISKFHPLVGAVIPNATKSTIFGGDFTAKQLNYLNDHALGNNIILPGTALLEMCVVAGHAAVQGLTEEFHRPRRPITLKGMRIEAPIPLIDGKPCVLQTLVNLDNSEDGLGYSVKIYNWLRTSNDGCNRLDGQWKSHVSSHFLPLVVDEEKALKKVDIQEIQKKWKRLPDPKELYEKMSEVGFRFGPTFQSLIGGWGNGKDENVEKSDSILFEVKVPEDDHENYLVHPVILDAMVQASLLWMKKDRMHKKLLVPIGVDNFTWYSDGDESDMVRYIYCKKGDDKEHDQNEMVTYLLDGSGTVLTSMSGVECIETTVKLIEAVIQQQSFGMPQLWEEIWKPKPGPLDGGTSASSSNSLDAAFNKEIIESCEILNEMDEIERKVYHHLDNLTVLYFVNALYQLGWVPEINQRINMKEFMAQLGIVDVALNFMKYFFNELIKEGIVERGDEDVFVIKALPETKENIAMLCSNIVAEEEVNRGDYRMVSEIGKQLSTFLTGKASPLTFLFPEDPSKPNFGGFYDQLREWISRTGEVINYSVSNYNHMINSRGNKDGVVLRVLEIGAGTGSGTKDIIGYMDEKDMNFEYTFTDISSAFFMNAEIKFEKFRKQMIFKKYNIDEDPLAQGFTPEYYDLILACEVVHAAKDIRRTMSYLRTLLKTNGFVQICEATKPDRRITLLVGLLEGYWAFTDFDLRSHATLSKDKWVDVLNSSGYKDSFGIGCYQDVHSYILAFAAEEYAIDDGKRNVYEDLRKFKAEKAEESKYSWLIFCDNSEASKEIQRRLKSVNRNVTLITNDCQYDMENGEKKIKRILKEMEGEHFEGIIYFWALSSELDTKQEEISLPFLHLVQSVLEFTKMLPRLYLYTQGCFIVQDDFMCSHPEGATIWGIAKTLRNEQPDLKMSCIDLCPDKDVNKQVNLMFSELFWTGYGEEMIAFRDGKRHINRLASLKIADESLPLPSFCDRFQLIIPSTKSIADLEFGFLNKYNLEDDEIEVEVKAAALNFRDIFAVLKPTPQFDEVNAIGNDFSGVVVKTGRNVTRHKIGDSVFGMNHRQQALPSHIKLKENMVIPFPDNFTYAEAATIPTVFATALYCLVTIAKIKYGDVILIHTASGGVGLSAVQIAQHYGAMIIATAGSRRKRSYLKSLGIEHVFHSRNTDYGEQIMNVTSGRGVDIVLNSLTGPGFKEASLGACAINARFVEMSKLNIWQKEEVRRLREDVDYIIADVTTLTGSELTGLMAQMMQAMSENSLKPIPYVRYDALNIRQALGYLQNAKHIGKVVCIMPENPQLSRKDGPNASVNVNLFNDRSTYLITGGLGGIGFEVAKFMLTSGTKHLILVGRSPPKLEIESMISNWNGDGKHVVAWQVDVGDSKQVKEMLDKIETNPEWPPLRGVMHAAGVLYDATLPNQTWEKFKKTYNAKVEGTMNLHNLTLNNQLEHFVLFSSVTSLFGSPGQSNHCASNSFEDSIAQYRHSIGLPATTINWANWGEVGVAQEIDFPGIRPIATKQGMKALEASLKLNRLHLCVMNVDSFGLVIKLFPKVKGYVDDKRLLGDIKTPILIVNPDQFWNEVDTAEGREAKMDVFKKYIKTMLRNNLKMDPDENISDDAEFQSLGVDSLMLLEMKNYMQNLFGNRLTLTAAHLKDCNTTQALVSKLVDMLEGNNGESNGNSEENNALENGPSAPPAENEC